MTQPNEPNPVDLHIGNAIRVRRNVLGKSQSDLAEGLGLTFQQIQKYERGTNRVSGSKLHAMAAVLGCAPGYFFPPVLEEGTVPVAPDPAAALMATPGGIQLAQIYPALTPRDRRAVMAVAISLAV